jgi:hypothetical protein
MQPPNSEIKKETYEKPELTIEGHLRDITAGETGPTPSD